MVKRRATGPDTDGFTLIELLVVMVVVGILGALASGALLSQRRKAQETSTKADLRSIVKEIQTYYVDDTGALTLVEDAATSTWSLASGATVVADGRLSPGNSVSASTTVDSSSSFCVAILATDSNARHFRVTPTGLEEGDC